LEAELVTDAVEHGAQVVTGGNRVGNKGNFLEPTVLTGVTPAMRIMNEEPFGPVAMIMPLRGLDDAVTEANRLPFGLAAYAFSRSVSTVTALAERVETGMLSTNHLGLALPETPFGGSRKAVTARKAGRRPWRPISRPNSSVSRRMRDAWQARLPNSNDNVRETPDA
jgi:succinate-semialdehyde dehydrogenase/glutarate-semialdehyde dehydrogenase